MRKLTAILMALTLPLSASAGYEVKIPIERLSGSGDSSDESGSEPTTPQSEEESKAQSFLNTYCMTIDNTKGTVYGNEDIYNALNPSGTYTGTYSEPFKGFDEDGLETQCAPFEANTSDPQGDFENFLSNLRSDHSILNKMGGGFIFNLQYMPILPQDSFKNLADTGSPFCQSLHSGEGLFHAEHDGMEGPVANLPSLMKGPPLMASTLTGGTQQSLPTIAPQVVCPRDLSPWEQFAYDLGMETDRNWEEGFDTSEADYRSPQFDPDATIPNEPYPVDHVTGDMSFGGSSFGNANDGLSNIKSVEGSFTISLSGDNGPSDLSFLSGLQKVGGEFNLSATSSNTLSSISGLSSLEEVGDLTLEIPDGVTNLSGFPSLNHFKSISIDGYATSTELTSIQGITNISGNSYTGPVEVSIFGFYTDLTAFSGFPDGNVSLDLSSPSLTTLEGFDLNEVASLEIGEPQHGGRTDSGEYAGIEDISALSSVDTLHGSESESDTISIFTEADTTPTYEGPKLPEASPLCHTDAQDAFGGRSNGADLPAISQQQACHYAYDMESAQMDWGWADGINSSYSYDGSTVPTYGTINGFSDPNTPTASEVKDAAPTDGEFVTEKRKTYIDPVNNLDDCTGWDATGKPDGSQFGEFAFGGDLVDNRDDIAWVCQKTYPREDIGPTPY